MSEPDRPLAGRRILLTRRAEQGAPLASRLTDLGASVVVVPAIEVGAPDDPGPLDEALLALDRYDWLVFTSPNAVEAVKARFKDHGQGPLPAGLKVACVGPTTAEALSKAYPESRVDLAPTDDFRAAGLLAAFAGLDRWPRRVLLPVSDRSRPELADGLRRLGAVVDHPTAYRTATPPGLAPRIREALAAGIDLVLLASPSAVQGLAETVGNCKADVPAVAIGPSTARAARKAGLRLLAVAEPSTTEGLVAAVIRVLGANGPPS
jgi:uroporphyrinogen-III synthase